MAKLRTPHNDPLIKQLIEILGLPKNLRSFELRVAVDEVVTVKCVCEYFPEENGQRLTGIRTGVYELHRVEPDPAPEGTDA